MAEWQQLQILFNLDYYLSQLLTKSNSEDYRRWGQHRASLNFQASAEGRFMEKKFEEMREDLRLLHGRYLQHAHGIRAMAMVAAGQLGEDMDLDKWDQLGPLLPNLFELPAVSANKVGSLREPIDGYRTAALHPDCSVSVLKEHFSFDNFLVTETSILFEVERPIEELIRGYDPRLWDIAAPETFEVADRFDESERDLLEPGATIGPPPTRADPALESRDAGSSAKFSLFEQAVTAAGGGTGKPLLADFRNLLSIELEVDPATNPSYLKLKYWLSEPITFVVNGAAYSGGLDRDSGFAFIEKIGPKRVRIGASKSVRIGRPPILRDLLNSNMAIILRFWFYNLVILGACSDREV